MPRTRYQPPSGQYSDDEAMPLTGQLTILTRQSTSKQKERHVYSQERNPDELVHEAHRMGFTDIQVYDWDTGIGAYKTIIEDRPALRYWLTALLPSGKSRVLMVSQEDRLFRDKWETEHNEFIRQVATHGG
jgi:DNA invertase Pin-like site-specific DNA recombinase